MSFGHYRIKTTLSSSMINLISMLPLHLVWQRTMSITTTPNLASTYDVIVSRFFPFSGQNKKQKSFQDCVADPADQLSIR